MINNKRIGLELSGCGYRAAPVHLDTLKKLLEMQLLDKIDVSIISDGSITCAAYCLHKGDFPSFYQYMMERITKKNLISTVLLLQSFLQLALFILIFLGGVTWLLFTPWALFSSLILALMIFLFLRYQFAVFPASRKVERAYDKFLYHRITLGDLKSTPVQALGSSNLQTERPITFSRDRMEDSTYSNYKPPIEFSPEHFPIVRAVMAASCVPFAFTPVPIHTDYYKVREDALCINPQLVDGGLKMKDAMDYFINRTKMENGPDLRFWNPGDLAYVEQIGMNGIKAYFLGPPKDCARLRQMEDHAHAEMYLDDVGLSDNYFMALTENGNEDDNSASPFNSKDFWSDADCSKTELDDNDHVWTLYHGKKNPDPELDSDNSWRKIEVDWLHNAGALALHLDSYTNNTSLVMAIEIEATGQVLLFPGDAQIGNWVSWTEPENEGREKLKLQWKVTIQGGKGLITAAALLEHTVFYKVGHPSNHNATAKKHRLELMTYKDLVAMIPVDQELAKQRGKRGWKMPADDLYERLKQKNKRTHHPAGQRKYTGKSRRVFVRGINTYKATTQTVFEKHHRISSDD